MVYECSFNWNTSRVLSYRLPKKVKDPGKDLNHFGNRTRGKYRNRRNECAVNSRNLFLKVNTAYKSQLDWPQHFSRVYGDI